MKFKNLFGKSDFNTILLVLIFLAFVLAMNVIAIFVFIFISQYKEGEFEYEVLERILNISVLEVYVVIFILLFTLIISHTKQFNNIFNGNESKKEFVIFVIFFGLLISLSMVSYTVVREFSVLYISAIFLASVSGRWKLCVWSTALATSISCIILYFEYHFIVPENALDLVITLIIAVSLLVLTNIAFTYKETNMKMLKYQVVANIIVSAIFGMMFHLSYPEYESVSIILEIIFFAVSISVIAILFKKWHGSYNIEYEAKMNKEELAIAHRIQMNAMPTVFIKSKVLNYRGAMESAVEMGGDFYDCYEIKKNLMAIVIADVSDKGLVAAMFMMKAKGAIKSIAMVENDPGRILKLANNQLCYGNEAEQFVTAWVGILDTDTGIIKYSDAGHTHPLVRKNGKYSYMQGKKGLVLGYMEDAQYMTSEMKLNDGDTLFLYTDGVTEARNEEDQMYGSDRLINIISQTEGKSENIINAVENDVSKFRGNAAMSDDITMFCLQMLNGFVSEINIESDESNLETVTEFINAKLIECGCPEDEMIKFDIVVEELFVNICSYAYGESKGNVGVFCRFIEDEIMVTFCDRGIPFDPVKRSEVLISDDVSNWSIGGFGIHMVKKMVDSMNYKRLCDINILTVRKKVGGKKEVKEQLS